MKIPIIRMKKKMWLCLAAVVLVLYCGIHTAKGLRGVRVETAEAQIQSIEDHYTEEGTITSGGEYRLVSQVPGAVKELLVAENDTVKKGDIIFTIDDMDLQHEKALGESTLSGYRAKLEQSRIGQVMTSSPQEYLSLIRQEVAAREADYKAAATVYQASDSLLAAGGISRVEWEKDRAAYEYASMAWEQARQRYEESLHYLESLKSSGIDETTINGKFYKSVEEQLNAQIQAQETTIKQLEEKIGKCSVTADRDGIITSLPVKNMSYIQAGETGAVIAQKGGIKAESDVLTNIAPCLFPGDRVTVVINTRNQDQFYNGSVEKVYGYAQKGVSALGLDEYRVHVIIDMDENQELEDKEGYGANIRFTLYQGENKLVIPSSSVFETDDQNFVYVIKKGKAQKQQVEVEYKTSSQAVIKAGLENGDKVIDHVDFKEVYEGARIYAGS
nr:biotin/lipoyl-binding protein [uncultured Clostridium sp.]